MDLYGAWAPSAIPAYGQLYLGDLSSFLYKAMLETQRGPRSSHRQKTERVIGHQVLEERQEIEGARHDDLEAK